MLVEVCCNSIESAVNAQKGGADRIELCSELGVGGITPSYGLLKAVREQVSIPVHVLIRPRSGDFSYSSSEFDIMLEDIACCVDMGFEGIVSGVLNRDFTLDKARTAMLLHASDRLHFTFHRAFDWVPDPVGTLQILEEIGITSILTSGQRPTALEGIGLLTELRQRAQSCLIMPGAGIGIQNAQLFKEHGFDAIHLSGTSAYQNVVLKGQIPMTSPNPLEDGKVLLSSEQTIREVIARVK